MNIKWPKMGQNGPNRLKKAVMLQDGQKRLKKGPKLTKMAKNGPIRPKTSQNSPKSFCLLIFSKTMDLAGGLFHLGDSLIFTLYT